jgi:hypothetical protein
MNSIWGVASFLKFRKERRRRYKNLKWAERQSAALD